MTETVRCSSSVTVVEGGTEGTLVGALKREPSLSVETVPSDPPAPAHDQKNHTAAADTLQVAAAGVACASGDRAESSESDADRPRARTRSPPVSPLSDVTEAATGMTPRLNQVEPTRTNKRKRAATPEHDDSPDPIQDAQGDCHRESSADVEVGETAGAALVANPADGVTETDNTDADASAEGHADSAGAAMETDNHDADASAEGHPEKRQALVANPADGVTETDNTDADASAEGHADSAGAAMETDNHDADASAEGHPEMRRSVTSGLWMSVDYLGMMFDPLVEPSQRAYPSQLVGATERARGVIKADIPQMAPPVCGRMAQTVALREFHELLHLLEPVATRHAAGLMAKAERLQVETHGIYNDVSLFGRPLPFDFIAMQCATVQLQRRARLPSPPPGGTAQGVGEIHGSIGKHEADKPAVRQQAQPNLVCGPGLPRPQGAQVQMRQEQLRQEQMRQEQAVSHAQAHAQARAQAQAQAQAQAEAIAMAQAQALAKAHPGHPHMQPSMPTQPRGRFSNQAVQLASGAHLAAGTRTQLSQVLQGSHGGRSQGQMVQQISGAPGQQNWCAFCTCPHLLLATLLSVNSFKIVSTV